MNLPWKASSSFLFIIFLCAESRCQTLDTFALPNQGICDSKDIRNSPSSLELLRNCSVIAGYLQIVLMEGYSEAHFAGYAFPELREITQFFLMYRVEGLSTLAHLFPNLTLIRGQKLIVNYAFIVYELPNLQELGLRSLTKILRGYVRVDRNNALCQAETIDWANITGSAVGHHFDLNGPSICPGAEACRGCEDNRCWSSRYCQRIPSPTCHPECLGGCDQISRKCYRCKNFSNGTTCLPSCPPNTFEFKEAFQCVSKELCRKLYFRQGWTWEGQCIKKCPKGYNEVKVNGTKSCEKCKDKCIIECYGDEINSLSDAQHFRGCNYVDGSLQIRYQGDYNEEIMREMEENLGDIEEIKGFLKIYRSIPLTSLNFLKNLSVIHGNMLEYNRYALVVYEMTNLQSLWTRNATQRLKLGNGTVFFHFNAKLCMNEIEEFQNMTEINSTSYDVSLESNGYKMTCNLSPIETELTVLDSRNVSISWDRFIPNATAQNDYEYYVYYIENKDDNVTTDYGRDSCYEHGWKSMSVKEKKGDNKTTPQKKFYANITDLHAYTRYAYYVEAYIQVEEGKLVNITGKNGQSVVNYFTTTMEPPSMPLGVETTSESTDALSILWEDDITYTGIITRYIVELYIQLDDTNFLDLRNYCVHPLVPPPKETPKANKTGEQSGKESKKDGECMCKESEVFWEKLIENETSSFEVNTKNGPSLPCKDVVETVGTLSATEFIDILRCNSLKYNVNDDDHERKERNTDPSYKDFKDFNVEPTPRPVLQNVTHNDRYHYFSTAFHTKHKNYTVGSLRHYSKYLIYLGACKGLKDVDCGSVAMVVQRTLKNDTADLIKDLTVSALNKSAIEAKWREPKNPNGAILTYTIEHNRLDIKNHKPAFECITRLQHEDNKWKYTLVNLNPGKYSFRVRATSLAGDSNFTEIIEFNVPEHGLQFDWFLFVGLSACLVIGIVALVYYKKRRSSDDRLDLIPGSVDIIGARFTAENDEDEDRIDIVPLFDDI